MDAHTHRVIARIHHPCCPLHTYSHADAGQVHFEQQQIVRQRHTHKTHTGHNKITGVWRCRQPLSPNHAVARSGRLPRTPVARKSAAREAERRQHGTDRQRRGKGRGEAAARVWRRQPPVLGEPVAPALDRRYHRACSPSGGAELQADEGPSLGLRAELRPARHRRPEQLPVLVDLDRDDGELDDAGPPVSHKQGPIL
jgi:hypothetical protein